MLCPQCGQETLPAQGKHVKRIKAVDGLRLGAEWYDRPHQGPKRYQQGRHVFWCCQTCGYSWDETIP